MSGIPVRSGVRTHLAWPIAAAFAAVMCAISSPVSAQERAAVDCGAWSSDRGPFDYNNPAQRQNEIALVEKYHWDVNVEELKRGKSSVYVLEDLDFILRYVPNHHRALNAVARYELAGSNMTGFYPAECYFRRAVQFKPDDGQTYLVLGIYRYRKKEYDQAIDAYERAITLMPESPEPHYNLALLHLALGDLARARERATLAYRLGYPLPGLKRKLRAAGAWSAEDEARTHAQ